MALILAISGCSYIGGTTANEQEIPQALALVDSKNPQPSTTTTSTVAESTTTAPATSVALGQTSESTIPTSATSTTAAVQDAGSAPKGTEAPVDLMSQYHGIVGNYTLHQRLATAPAAAPTAKPGISPLTGWPITVSATGPAVVVKIDNSGKATPQSGLNVADIVIEEEVEWGITRLAAIFHSEHAAVGPVRSGRTTDISFLGALGNPALAYSGANQIIDTLLLRQDYVQNFSAARSGAYWRDSSRRAPSNLYTNSASFTSNGSAPSPWFGYRPAGMPASGTPANSLALTMGQTNISWDWAAGIWLRSQRGSPHRTDGGAQVSATNVIVATVPMVDTGMVDSAGGMVPEFIWAGSGPVSVYTDGQRIDGTWTRATLADPAILTDSSGAVIELTQGRTWVELVAQP